MKLPSKIVTILLITRSGLINEKLLNFANLYTLTFVHIYRRRNIFSEKQTFTCGFFRCNVVFSPERIVIILCLSVFLNCLKAWLSICQIFCISIYLFFNFYGQFVPMPSVSYPVSQKYEICMISKIYEFISTPVLYLCLADFFSAIHCCLIDPQNLTSSSTKRTKSWKAQNLLRQQRRHNVQHGGVCTFYE